ncbi:phenylalanine--tRNA ligase subunit beta [Thiomicrospira sp. WB1]|uniref:phenylalanine--tRNA ligase subunit beta n=1 Tax=Thiomicrospira sp. WB1 TaxID=1685380 RepID=UPI00074628F8|nr:phenylalanine--tRNA ligase subunit beta [Thiomicrospira sp. WB1]KUJ71792.1 phenylalanine--tRNA ligase subunit beta [Thiomicrospira sp. WB1]
MKVSERWLREWTNPDLTTDALAELLSLAGLEVDAVDPVAPDFEQVVVGEVVSVAKHPDADKLNVTQVEVGQGEPLQIVCGAPNVTQGMKACCAQVGAVLPGDFKIKKAKLRGVPSHGMLCGATELGLPDDGSGGLMVLPPDAPVGENVRDYLALNDHVIDIDLTPNRADCLSVSGLSRDLAAMANTAWQRPFELAEQPGQGLCEQAVTVSHSEACPKYLGCMYEGFDPTADTPLWMRQRLQRSGVTPKALMVDVTNYVMLELGQPLHAFDADALQGTVTVRWAQSGEKMVTLEDKTVTLDANTLVIADSQGPVALAGIMGGRDSAVTEGTQRVFFESAHFAPSAIIGKARAYGLHTDASHRFERGVDPALPEEALDRVQQLLLSIAGGRFSERVACVNAEHLPKATTIEMRPSAINQRLGTQISPVDMQAILARLAFSVQGDAQTETWTVTCPTWRFDMTIEADLMEEIGRIHGYNHLPETPVTAPMRLPHVPETEQEVNLLRRALVQRGYYEVMTYSFISEARHRQLTPEIEPLVLQNPISDDMKVMRASLLPGLLATVAYNQARQQGRVRLFESGRVFLPETDRLQQVERLGGVVTGLAHPRGWEGQDRPVDFYDLKGDVEALLNMNGLLEQIRFVASELKSLHPGQSADIVRGDSRIGYLGQLHPKLSRDMDLQWRVFVFELELDALREKPLPQAETISRFPAVQRDLAFVMPQAQPVQALKDAIALVPSDWLRAVDIFDVYQGEGLADDEKSVALSLHMQRTDRTLEDAEVEALISAVIEKVGETTGARLRDDAH